MAGSNYSWKSFFLTWEPRQDETISLRSTQVDPLGSSEDSQYFNQD